MPIAPYIILLRGERESDAPSIFLGDDERKVWMPPSRQRPFDDIDAWIGGRKQSKTAIFKPDNAPEATAMHDAPAHLLHDYCCAAGAGVDGATSMKTSLGLARPSCS